MTEKEKNSIIFQNNNKKKHLIPYLTSKNIPTFSKKENIFKIFKVKKINNWTKKEEQLLKSLVGKMKIKRWRIICKSFQGKSALQCASRYRRMIPGIKKGYWTKEEDKNLLEFYKIYKNNWKEISNRIKTRSYKQVRDRFYNNLDPNLKKGKFSDQEDKNLVDLFNKYGPKWSFISQILKNRSSYSVKNRIISLYGNKNLNYLKVKMHKRILMNKISEGIIIILLKFLDNSKENLELKKNGIFKTSLNTQENFNNNVIDNNNYDNNDDNDNSNDNYDSIDCNSQIKIIENFSNIKKIKGEEKNKIKKYYENDNKNRKINILKKKQKLKKPENFFEEKKAKNILNENIKEENGKFNSIKFLIFLKKLKKMKKNF